MNRYPSPLARHIIYQDTLDSHYDSDTNILSVWKITRKSGKLPKWAPKIPIAESWVLEETKVDLLQGTLDSESRNLDLKQYCTVADRFHISEIDANS